MRRYPLIIFDLDGTLIDSLPGIVLGMNATLADFDIDPIDLDWVRRNVGHGVRPLLAAAAGSSVKTDELLVRFRRRYREVLLENSPPLPGVDATLRNLAHNHTLAIASNKPLAWVDDLVDHFGWRGLMAVVAGPELVDSHKPEPQMLEYILRETGFQAPDALFVGDMQVDGETGVNAGITTVGVTTGAASGEELLEAGCSVVLESVVDLECWITSCDRPVQLLS